MAFSYHQQPSKVSATDQLICSACKVTVLPTERNSHYRSDWHRYNVKRKCVNMEPIEKSVFEAKLKSIITSGQQMDSISSKKRKKAMNKTIQKNYDTLISNDQWSSYKPSSQPKQSLLTYKCTVCEKTFKTHQQCLSHLKTKKHKQEFIKYHKRLRQMQQEEIHVYNATNEHQNSESSVQNPSMDNLIPIDKLKPLLTIENNPFISIKQAKIYHKHRGIHNHKNNDDESKFNDNDDENVEGKGNGNGNGEATDDQKTSNPNDDDKEQEQRSPIDPCKSCLFCTHTFESESESESESQTQTQTSGPSAQELAIEHMIDKHGFFIPIPKRVTNLDELLSTAGHIIGEYHQCVWCWRIFKSVRGCQAHMRHTGHCKLRLEYSSNITYSKDSGDMTQAIVNDNEDSPFLKYFDFDKVIIDTDEEDNGVTEDGLGRELMVREKRYITDINDCDELVRSDGTVIGHRDHMIAYRQKHRNLSKYNETQTEGQIIAQINNPQRKLKLQEMESHKHKVAFEKSGAKEQAKGRKRQEKESMYLQTKQHKVTYENWVSLQKSKGLF